MSAPSKRGQQIARRPIPPDALAYRVPDAATMIGVSKSKVWAMIAANELPARKIGAATVIRHEDLKAFINATKPVVRHTP
ncbi:helix-turn-helix domain-containing protein [Methylobacterium sp. J-059]|uniref:helix-turn-helix domain-containing protein n=1 Tax=Methylobacterium sp. J-059 TaxID=2836643 RepID=UPI001FB98113|nr:helix-turn-helix domain-containing protein [Methylobacterium sp. J-059]MCJ2039045.1 helix-turn-helix domain-containing protein [Methylobacterium sp. J-059]